MGLCHRSVAGWVSVLLRTFHFPSLNRRPWRSISKRLFNKVTFALQRTLLLQALSSWPRTTEACALVSITGHSTKSQSSSVILFLSSQRHSNITKLDLRSLYNLIRIHEGDEWKTAFVTPSGHNEYRVMSYGLVNAPFVFQDFMHEVLWEYIHRFVLVYIDDILFYSWSMAEHRLCWLWESWMWICPASLSAACLSEMWWSTDRWRWAQRAVSVCLREGRAGWYWRPNWSPQIISLHNYQVCQGVARCNAVPFWLHHPQTCLPCTQTKEGPA